MDFDHGRRQPFESRQVRVAKYLHALRFVDSDAHAILSNEGTANRNQANDAADGIISATISIASWNSPGTGFNNISKKWTMPLRDWKGALNRFTIQFEERMSPV